MSTLQIKRAREAQEERKFLRESSHKTYDEKEAERLLRSVPTQADGTKSLNDVQSLLEREDALSKIKYPRRID